MKYDGVGVPFSALGLGMLLAAALALLLPKSANVRPSPLLRARSM
jgi:hypothetical protein